MTSRARASDRAHAMKWYFALSERSVADSQYVDLLRVAVHSAVQTTRLRPFMLWDGGQTELTRSLERLGVTIVPCISRFAELIHHRWTEDKLRRIALGAFMRLEIPTIEREEDFVLYTDCDVMFMKDPRLRSFRPEFLSIAPEFEFGNYDDINSGVIVMNVRGMRREQARFDRFVTSNFADLHTFDQTALMRFYCNRFDYLPPTLNWKPYWGPGESIEILHFHLKPYFIRMFAQNHDTSAIADLAALYGRSPDYCRQAADGWYTLLQRARCSILPARAEQWPADFDGAKYLELYPDVAIAGVDPFSHYTSFGAGEGRARPAPPS